MYKKIKKKAVSCFLLFSMVFVMFSQSVFIAEAVKPSNTDYTVNVNGNYVFIGSETAGSKEIGTEYYMTYTVKSAPVVTMEQQGIIGSVDIVQRNPFENGGFIRWTTNEEFSLLVEGATYFIKFTSADGGFTYDITRVKDGETKKIVLEEYWGWPEGGFSHFGLWISGPVQADLIKVRCYDASGKDLGVTMTPWQGNVFEDVVLQKNEKVEHSYEIEVKDQYCVALSNLRKPTSDRVYMEYTVESSNVWLSQEGTIITDKPLKQYPYQSGAMRYNTYLEGTDESVLLDPGASYILQFDIVDGEFEVIVQKIKNGERTLFTFTNYIKGSMNEKADYFSLWFGDYSMFLATFHLTDFKCYDSNNNNLGVQCNTSYSAKHFGEYEDYAGCEATYYCKENGNSFGLYSDQTLKFTENNVTTEGTYVIDSDVMNVKLKDEDQKFQYMYHQITDETGNIYVRLGQYTVQFVTKNETDIPQQELSNETGYYAMRPTDPVVEGKEFEGWYTGDGQSFDFDKIVTESTILYAKYTGDIQVEGKAEFPIVPVVIAGAAIVAVVLVAIVMVLAKRGGRYGSNKKE